MSTRSRRAPARSTDLTLLLTDVESSTLLWERSPAHMENAIDRLDKTLRRVVAAHSGKLVKSKGEGDSAFAVFEDPIGAVNAALDLQKVLCAEEWATELPLRIRMGINVGPVLRRSNDYFGEPVHRAARLRAAAHGGQILLSEELGRRVRPNLPTNISLRDLGLRRLKDLKRPERIYQLVHPDLNQTFPPITTLDPRSQNLPVQPTEFVGRQREIETIKRLLRGQTRLLTLTGPGGVGKTRVALQAAADLIDDFDNGIWVAMLAEVQDASLIPNAVASALRVKETPGATATQALIAHLAATPMLLVLDNFEHVLEAAPFVGELLSTCPDLKVLVTSRSWLNLRAEHHLEIGPLPVPEDPDQLSSEDVEAYDALALFSRRVAAVNPSFQPSRRDIVLMARVCARLEGLPLALELAAAQMRTRGLDQMLDELENRLKVLVEGPVDLPPRHQALRAAIGWSYDLLTDQQRRLMNRLGVFAGSFDAERAESLTGATRADLKPLIQHHLVTAEEDERCRFLETVRDFALEKLADSGEEEPLRRRHFEVFLEASQKLGEGIGGPNAGLSISTFLMWLPDLRAALDWAAANDRARGVQMAINLYPLWVPAGLNSEGRRSLNEYLPDAPSLDPPTQVTLHHAIGWMGLVSADTSTAKSHLEKAIQLEDQALPGMRSALRAGLGTTLTMMGDIPGAKRVLEEALTLPDEEHLPRTLANIHNGLGIIASMSANYEEARGHWEEARKKLAEIGDLASLSSLLVNLAGLAFNQGDLQGSHDIYVESAEVARKLGSVATLSKSLNGLGQTAIEREDFDEADAILSEAVDLRRETEDPQGLAFSLMNLAKVKWRKSRTDEAVRMSDEAMEVARKVGNPQLTASLLLIASEIRMETGTPDEAARLLVESLGVLNAIGDLRGVAVGLEVLAGCIAKKSPRREALVLLGAADELREKAGGRRMPADERFVERLAGEVAGAISGEDSNVAREQGRSMDGAAAVELALNEAKAFDSVN